MPKVSKYGFRVQTTDIHKYMELDVEYNSGDLFFIQIPKEYLEVFKLLPESELRKCNSRLYLKKGHYGDENRSAKVSGASEVEVKTNCDMLFKVLQENSVSKEDVIIVTFEHIESGSHYSRRNSRYNEEHQKIGMNIALKYCTKVTLGDKVRYNTYSDGPIFSGETKPLIVASEIHTGSDDVIIPDTEENRVFLEGVYSKFKLLIENVHNHLSTPEGILTLIASNQKLIG